MRRKFRFLPKIHSSTPCVLYPDLRIRHPNGIAVEDLMREYRANLGGGDLDEAVANCGAGGVREMVRLVRGTFPQWFHSSSNVIIIRKRF